MCHTASVSAIPDSSSSSLAAWLGLGLVILLSSLFKLLRSDLYSLSFASKPAFALGGKLLASRSIFRIYINNPSEFQDMTCYTWKLTYWQDAFGHVTRFSASSIPDLISDTFCFFFSANAINCLLNNYSQRWFFY